MKFSAAVNRKNILLILTIGLLLSLIAAVLFLYLAYVPKRYTEAVSCYAEEYGVEEELAFAVIRAESNFREEAVSSAGARGLMQLMPPTAQFIAENIGENLSIDSPEDNIRMGVWYLAYLSEKFEGQTEVLAAYNAGEGAVRQWLRDADYSQDGKSLREIPLAETRKYVQRDKKFYNCYKFFY